MKKIILFSLLIFPCSENALCQEIGFPFGVPVENGAVPVVIQDQTTEIIDLHLTRFIDDITITQNTSLDDTTVYIQSSTAPVVGNSVCFKESYAFFQAEISQVTPTGGDNYTIIIDSEFATY